MALAYDWSYQEWLKSHPKKVIPAATTAVRTLKKQVIAAQAPKKPTPIADPRKVWDPKVKAGFHNKKEWRQYMSGHRDRWGMGGHSGGTGGSVGRTGGAY